METPKDLTETQDASKQPFQSIIDFFSCTAEDQRIIFHMLLGNKDHVYSSKVYLSKKASFDKYFAKITKFSQEFDPTDTLMAIKNDPSRLQHILNIKDRTPVPLQDVLDNLLPNLGLLSTDSNVQIAEFMFFETIIKESKDLQKLNLQQLKDLFLADEVEDSMQEKEIEEPGTKTTEAVMVENNSDDSLDEEVIGDQFESDQNNQVSSAYEAQPVTVTSMPIQQTRETEEQRADEDPMPIIFDDHEDEEKNKIEFEPDLAETAQQLKETEDEFKNRTARSSKKKTDDSEEVYIHDDVRENSKEPEAQEQPKSRPRVQLPKLNLAPIVEKAAGKAKKKRDDSPSDGNITALLAPYQPRPHEVNYDKDLEIFKIVFEVFDDEKTGFISRDDILIITVSMKKDFQLVKATLEKIQSLKQQEMHQSGEDHDINPEQVSFGEFATLMWQVEQQQTEAQREAFQGKSFTNDKDDFFNIQNMSTNSPHKSTQHSQKSKKKYQIDVKKKGDTNKKSPQQKNLINLKKTQGDESNMDRFDREFLNSPDMIRKDSKKEQGRLSNEFQEAVQKIGRDIESPLQHGDQRKDQKGNTTTGSPTEITRRKKDRDREGLIKIKEMRRGDGDISDDSNLDENIEFALGFNKTVDRNERPRVPGLTESAQISNPELAKTESRHKKGQKDAKRTSQGMGFRTQREKSRVNITDNSLGEAASPSAMTKEKFLATLQSNNQSPILHHPLELQSEASSLRKLEVAGYGQNPSVSPSFKKINSTSSPLKSPDQKPPALLGGPLAQHLQKEYGDMFPKCNLTALPDSKVTEFIRILSEYQHKMESHQQYVQAKKARCKVRELAQIELLRQIATIRAKHDQELVELKDQQHKDKVEFQETWAEYLGQEEQRAKDMIAKTKEKFQYAVEEKKKEVQGQYHKFIYSKKYCKLREQEKIFFSVKNYIEAERCSKEKAGLEKAEKLQHEQNIREKVEQEVEKLKKFQLQQMEAVMKRIRRDRNEQLATRTKDTLKIIKRVKLEINMLLEKQQVEVNTLITFLRYSLGARAPKHVKNDEIQEQVEMQMDMLEAELSTSRYQKYSQLDQQSNPSNNISQISKYKIEKSNNNEAQSNYQEQPPKEHKSRQDITRQEAIDNRSESKSVGGRSNNMSNFYTHSNNGKSRGHTTPLGSSRIYTKRDTSRTRGGKITQRQAYEKDRRPTIQELASHTFMGVHEARPADLLREELQNSVQSRQVFFRPEGINNSEIKATRRLQQIHRKKNLPKLKDMSNLLKMKFEHKSELNNLNPNWVKQHPLKTFVDSDKQKFIQMTQINTPVRARTNQMLEKLVQYRVKPNLLDKSIHFDEVSNVEISDYKKLMNRSVANQFYCGSKQNFYKRPKLRLLTGEGFYQEPDPSHFISLESASQQQLDQLDAKQTFSQNGPQLAGQSHDFNTIQVNGRTNTQSNSQYRTSRIDQQVIQNRHLMNNTTQEFGRARLKLNNEISTVSSNSKTYAQNNAIQLGQNIMDGGLAAKEDPLVQNFDDYSSQLQTIPNKVKPTSITYSAKQQRSLKTNVRDLNNSDITQYSNNTKRLYQALNSKLDSQRTSIPKSELFSLKNAPHIHGSLLNNFPTFKQNLQRNKIVNIQTAYHPDDSLLYTPQSSRFASNSQYRQKKIRRGAKNSNHSKFGNGQVSPRIAVGISSKTSNVSNNFKQRSHFGRTIDPISIIHQQNNTVTTPQTQAYQTAMDIFDGHSHYQ